MLKRDRRVEAEGFAESSVKVDEVVELFYGEDCGLVWGLAVLWDYGFEFFSYLCYYFGVLGEAEEKP